MIRLSLLTCILIAALSPAALAQTTVVSAPDAQTITAQGGAIAWVDGKFGSQRLMLRRADGSVAPVEGAPVALSYRSIDLGLDEAGRLVLTYSRCMTSVSKCSALRDDLGGHRSSFKSGYALRRCVLSTAPALWRGRAVYGLSCRKSDGETFDASRSGLYFKNGSAAPRRLGIPKEARRAGADSVDQVDIRRAAIAAVASDVSHFAWYRWASPESPSRTWLVATNEGDTSGQANGLAIGARTHVFSLGTSSHPEEPNVSVLTRLTEQCLETQVMKMPEGPGQHDRYPATDVAADGERLYLLVPGTGVVTHRFVADRPC